MNTFYIDTCALKWRYVNSVNPAATTTINQIINNPNNQVVTSTLTLLEWSSALAVLCRQNAMNYNTFKINERALMTDIAQDRLIPLPQYERRMIEKARLLIEYVGVVNGRGLKTGDSIQLVIAREAAYYGRMPIEFLTSDKALASIINDFDVFRPYLTAHYISPT